MKKHEETISTGAAVSSSESGVSPQLPQLREIPFTDGKINLVAGESSLPYQFGEVSPEKLIGWASIFNGELSLDPTGPE